MSYYTGRGDYYSGKGDPGLFSTLGSIVSGVGKVVSNPIGAVGSLVSKLSSVNQRVSSTNSMIASSGLRLPTPVPGITGTMQRLVPGGQSGYTCGSSPCNSGYHLDKATRSKCVRNRKVNYTNPRALSRAAKRMDGFVTVARKALKSTNYKVVAKSYKANYRKPLKR